MRKLKMNRKEYMRKWRKENKDKISKSDKKFNENNKEKRKEWGKNYYRNNKENHLEKMKDYYETNKEKVKEICRKWRKSNEDKIKEYYQKDRIKNRIKHQARRLALKFIPIPKGYLCEVCNKELAVERHHEDYDKPLAVDLVCLKCHTKLDKIKQQKDKNGR